MRNNCQGGTRCEVWSQWVGEYGAAQRLLASLALELRAHARGSLRIQPVSEHLGADSTARQVQQVSPFQKAASTALYVTLRRTATAALTASSCPCPAVWRGTYSASWPRSLKGEGDGWGSSQLWICRVPYRFACKLRLLLETAERSQTKSRGEVGKVSYEEEQTRAGVQVVSSLRT